MAVLFSNKQTEEKMGKRKMVPSGDMNQFPSNRPSLEEALAFSSLEEQTRKILRTLTPRELKILRMRFGIGFMGDTISEEKGSRFSITRARVRQIEAKALRKLARARKRKK